MTGTAIPFATFGPTGFIAPAESAILDGARADIDAAFGTPLNPELTTAQGQIASTIAAVVGNKNDQFLGFINGVDPAFSSGRMQDGIARIYFLGRNPALPTTVSVLCSGGQVPIQTGALLMAEDGNMYRCTQGATIPASGSITLTFSCIVTGPIACPAQSFTIYQAIGGWDSAVALVDGVPGRVVESAADFETRRSATVGQNSMGFPASVRGAVLALPGVLGAFVYDNSRSVPVVIAGVTIPARSLYVSVAGGDTSAIANAIWTKKAPGCDYAGSTTVTVFDTSPEYPAPGIPYQVSFDIQQTLPFGVVVTLVNNPSVPSTAASLIQTAVVAAFTGANGGPRATAGATVLASRLYAAVTALGAWANILSVLIGSTNTAAAVVTGSISGTILTVTAMTTGALAIGQILFGSGLADGTVIAGFGTGAGGVGTYVLGAPQTVLSTVMTAVVPALNAVAVNANQAPDLAAGNVLTVLNDSGVGGLPISLPTSTVPGGAYPTSPAGLPIGSVWQDGDVLRIVTVGE
jgi:small basic protein